MMIASKRNTLTKTNLSLRENDKVEKRIGLALIGAGKMGRSIIHQTKMVNEVDLLIVSDIHLDKAVKAVESAGYKYEIVTNSEEAIRSIDKGVVAISTDASLIKDIQQCDVVIDATGNIEFGAYAGYTFITSKKNLVMMNAEADATYGVILSKFAELAGVVYTGDIGDEPGTIMYHLYNPLKTIGFKIIVAGKGKNNPLLRYATPEIVAEEAKRKKLNPRVLCSFVDGTKTMIEMNILSNATGLKTDKPGMHGPHSDVAGLKNIFKIKEKGGILNSEGVVDYVIGIAPGVFVVADIEDEEIRENLKYLKIGDEPPYVFYHPFHLPGNATLFTAIWVAIYKTPIICPIGHYTDTVAFAKKDLEPGEIIDGIGGYSVYGMIVNREEAAEKNLLPIGLSEGAIVKKRIEKDRPISFEDVEIREGFAYRLWSVQEKVIG